MINSDLDSHGLRIRWIEIRNIDDSLSVWDLRSLGTHDFGRGLSLWVLLSETSEESRLLILGVANLLVPFKIKCDDLIFSY